MRSRNTLTAIIAAVTLFCVSGCCETTNTATTTAVNGQPALLGSSTACPPPPAPRTRGVPACGEVKGDLVYNLGCGAISNSSAVRLSGGVEKPNQIRIQGGVNGRCNPLPDKYLEQLKRNALKTPAPAPAAAPAPAVTQAPVAPPAEQPWEPGVAGSGYCAPVACPIPADSALVCGPGADGISECFTLSEEQLRTGPELFVPSAAAPAAPVVEPARVEPAETPQVTIPPLSSAPVPTEVVEVAAVVEVIPAPMPAPEATEAKAPATSKYDHIPPVPEVTDMDRAAEAILASDRGEGAALPEVQLPPSLN